jgi:hypothetical protein
MRAAQDLARVATEAIRARGSQPPQQAPSGTIRLRRGCA